TDSSSWYNLNKARVHLLPYSHPYPELAVASTISPSGGMLAGRYGLGLLCLAAAEHGMEMNPRRLRLVAPMYIAETREKARADVAAGLARWCEYFSRPSPGGGIFGPLDQGDPVDALIKSGR